MSNFLLTFSENVVNRLLTQELLVLRDGASSSTVSQHVALHLQTLGKGHSIVSSFAAALIACPDVDELYAEDDTLKEAIDAVPVEALPRG